MNIRPLIITYYLRDQLPLARDAHRTKCQGQDASGNTAAAFAYAYVQCYATGIHLAVIKYPSTDDDESLIIIIGRGEWRV